MQNEEMRSLFTKFHRTKVIFDCKASGATMLRGAEGDGFRDAEGVEGRGEGPLPSRLVGLGSVVSPSRN